MKTLVLSCCFTALLVARALAAGEMDFAVVDTDYSGEITLEEAVDAGWEWTAEEFKAADEDGDGTLSPTEFTTATAA